MLQDLLIALPILAILFRIIYLSIVKENKVIAAKRRADAIQRKLDSFKR